MDGPSGAEVSKSELEALLVSIEKSLKAARADGAAPKIVLELEGILTEIRALLVRAV